MKNQWILDLPLNPIWWAVLVTGENTQLIKNAEYVASQDMLLG